MATKDNDRMTPANIKKVMEMLSPTDGTKPWTKKECCAFLGMSYNTTKLATIIKNLVEDEELSKTRKAANKYKPVSSTDLIFMIQEYIEGSSIDAIAERVYRSTNVVRDAIVRAGVTFRTVSHDYFNPDLVPDAAVRDRFNIGEVVYSVRYACNAEIRSEQLDEKHGYVYRVWLMGDMQQFAYTAAYDLASLQHLRDLGVAV